MAIEAPPSYRDMQALNNLPPSYHEIYQESGEIKEAKLENNI
jgi:hypothetical protein